MRRAGKTLTSAEFPGTAVLWEDRYFEVIDAQPMAPGGVQYTLEPWSDHHVMRVVDQYDEPSEAARLADHRAAVVHEQKRKSANLLALLTGHLPAVVQNAMGRDLGLLPARITLISVLGVYAVVVASAVWIASGIIHQTPRPFWAIVLTAWFAIETTVRFFIAWTQSRPIGSPAGLLAYIAWWLLTGRRGTSPFAVEKGWDVKITDAPEEISARDLLMLREPFLTLLPSEEQRRIATRFGYDYRRYSAGIAIGILFFAALGIASSLHRGGKIALLIAVALACEQVYRLVVMRRRPVGSVFSVLVWPFVRKLL